MTVVMRQGLWENATEVRDSLTRLGGGQFDGITKISAHLS
jgi:hypothetical protein